ncbi:hypothetical protein GCM10007383_34710 [Arenibacter certesii]|uniref:Uncharacterized protein n=1 Tax=Arenibacter certesii TaxID=228955 RepID=A0A918MPQ6_9FLAO|nr:hypothetical protein GCM10007383_34710 [Arenibacter certesii]
MVTCDYISFLSATKVSFLFNINVGVIHSFPNTKPMFYLKLVNLLKQYFILRIKFYKATNLQL